MRPVLLLITLLLACPGQATAQIVNIERILAGEPSQGVEGAVSAGFDLSRGNSDSEALQGSGLIRWRRDRIILQLVGNGSFAEARGVKVADNALGHLRLGVQTTSRLRLEGLLQVQQDAFIRLRRRILAGAGIRAALHSPGEEGVGGGRLDVGLILMHESELLRDRPDPDPRWRGSLLVSLGWELDERVEVGTQLYFQPVVDEFSDHRLLGDAGLTVRLLGPLSLQVQARLVRDSRPPEGVELTDVTLRNLLSLGF